MNTPNIPLIAPDEIFKPITGHEVYLISNYGRVFSLKSDKIIKCYGQDNNQIYKYTHIGRGATKSIHRLVAQEFIARDNADETNRVEFVDGDKSNCYYKNLKWASGMPCQRQCEMINIKTGKIILAKSVFEFCKTARLNGNDKFHIHPVLEGERLHHKNWTTKETFDKLNTLYGFKDIYGNSYQYSLLELKNSGFASLGILLKLIEGKRNSYKGLFLSDREVNFIPPRDYKVNKYYFKKGNRSYCAETLKEFEELHGVSSRSLWDLKSGRIDQCSGFVFDKVVTEKRSVLD